MSVVRVEWVDSETPQVIGYKVYRNGVRINLELVPVGVRVYDDDTAIKDQLNTYVVQAVTSNDETTDEVQGENKLSITPIQTVTPKVWTLVQQNDFSVNTNGVAGFNGTVINVANGLLEVNAVTGGTPGVNPVHSFISGDVYKFVFDIISHTSVNPDAGLAYMRTWTKTVLVKNFKDYELPWLNQEISFSWQNMILAGGIVYAGGFITGEKLIMDNCKLYRLV